MNRLVSNKMSRIFNTFKIKILSGTRNELILHRYVFIFVFVSVYMVYDGENAQIFNIKVISDNKLYIICTLKNLVFINFLN